MPYDTRLSWQRTVSLSVLAAKRFPKGRRPTWSAPRSARMPRQDRRAFGARPQGRGQGHEGAQGNGCHRLARALQVGARRVGQKAATTRAREVASRGLPRPLCMPCAKARTVYEYRMSAMNSSGTSPVLTRPCVSPSQQTVVSPGPTCTMVPLSLYSPVPERK